MYRTGKGRWIRLDTKTTVEASLKLPISSIRKPFHRESGGTLTWTWMSNGPISIDYFIRPNAGKPFVILDYLWRKTEQVAIPVDFQSTPTQFGGRRWWFTCPLILNGIACNRRVGKLYLPASAKYFGCRHCHKLAYRSSQEAYQVERAFCFLTGGRGFDRSLFDRFMEHMKGER